MAATRATKSGFAAEAQRKVCHPQFSLKFLRSKRRLSDNVIGRCWPDVSAGVVSKYFSALQLISSTLIKSC